MSHLALLVLEGEVAGEDVRVLQPLGHVRVARAVVQHQAAHQPRVLVQLVPHVHELHLRGRAGAGCTLTSASCSHWRALARSPCRPLRLSHVPCCSRGTHICPQVACAYGITKYALMHFSRLKAHAATSPRVDSSCPLCTATPADGMGSPDALLRGHRQATDPIGLLRCPPCMTLSEGDAAACAP